MGEASDLPDVEFRYHTKYVDIAPLSDRPVCAGTLARIDDHIEFMMSALGIRIDDRIPLYFSFSADDFASDWCGPRGVLGCVRPHDRVVFSNAEALPHELVHAVTITLGISWWIEGIAYAFSVWPLVPSYNSSYHDTVGESGHLSRWILETHGADAYMALYEQTPHGASQLEVEAAVRDVLGQEMPDLLSDYAATAAEQYHNPWACYVPPGTVTSSWTGDFWRHEARFDCAQDDTFNANTGEEARMSVQIPITIPAGGYYSFLADHPDAELHIQPCATEPLVGPLRDPGLSSRLLGLYGSKPYLDPGPYVLSISVPLGAPAQVQLQGYLAIGDFPVP